MQKNAKTLAGKGLQEYLHYDAQPVFATSFYVNL
jgi:hypothetical protein